MLNSLGNSQAVSTVMAPLYTLTGRAEGFQLSTSSPILVIFHFLMAMLLGVPNSIFQFSPHPPPPTTLTTMAFCIFKYTTFSSKGPLLMQGRLLLLLSPANTHSPQAHRLPLTAPTQLGHISLCVTD